MRREAGLVERRRSARSTATGVWRRAIRSGAAGGGRPPETHDEMIIVVVVCSKERPGGERA